MQYFLLFEAFHGSFQQGSAGHLKGLHRLPKKSSIRGTTEGTSGMTDGIKKSRTRKGRVF